MSTNPTSPTTGDAQHAALVSAVGTFGAVRMTCAAHTLLVTPSKVGLKLALKRADRNRHSVLASITHNGMIVGRPDVVAHALRGATDIGATFAAYGRATGRCSACGKLITDPVSRHRGLGPDCARKLKRENGKPLGLPSDL